MQILLLERNNINIDTISPVPRDQGPPLFWIQTILETSVTFGHFELSLRTLMIWALYKYIAALRNSPYICPPYF